MWLFVGDNLYLAGLAFLPGVLIFIHIYRTLRRPISQLPGPWLSKWTDLLAAYYFLTGKKAKYIQRLHQRYGPVVRVSPYEVDFADVAATREIYGIKETYLKAPFYSNLFPDKDIINVFSTREVDQHRRYRRLLSNPLSESSLKTLYPIVEANVHLAILKMREEMGTRGAVDVCKWWILMATDIIGELSFGESFRMLEQGRKNQYVKDIESSAPASGILATFPILAGLSRFVPVPVIRNAAVAVSRQLRYAEESLERHRRWELSDPTNARPTLFRGIYKAEGEKALTFKEMRDNAISYIIAGSDTTANTLTYLVWAVCRDPEVKAALVRELASLPGDGFGDAELKQLPYLSQVIDESLRLYPAVPSGLPRLVPQAGATLAGHWIEGGVTVTSQAYSLHRDPVVFPEPEKFDPSRWESPTKAMKESFFAFGGGARICIGLHLARMELRLATAQFFRAFPDAKVSTLEGMCDDDMEQMLHFLLFPKSKRCLIEV